MIWQRIIEQPAARVIPSGQSSHAAWDTVSCRGDAGAADRRESSQRDAGKVLERAELVPAQVLNEQISAEIDAVLLSLLVFDRLCWPVVLLSFGLHCPAVPAVAVVWVPRLEKRKLAAARASGTAEAANKVSEAYDACEPHPGDGGRCRLENGLAIQGQAPTALQLPAAADCR